jgi:hypothetical protein
MTATTTCWTSISNHWNNKEYNITGLVAFPNSGTFRPTSIFDIHYSIFDIQLFLNFSTFSPAVIGLPLRNWIWKFRIHSLHPFRTRCSFTA